jgi:large subunit ribosomal protein L25
MLTMGVLSAFAPTPTMSLRQHLRTAQSLPPRLISFFEKYPPPSLLHFSAPAPAPAPPAADIAPPIAPADPVVSPVHAEPAAQEALRGDFSVPRDIPAEAQAGLPYPNPFLPRKNHTTGRWYGPVFGLRQQADLVKLAQKHDVLELLPWTIKKPGAKEQRRIERGLQVKGTGEGQKVKGKLWERTLKGRLEMRKKAMMEMPALIQEWKQVSLIGVIDAGSWYTDKCTEGTWARMEEISLRQERETKLVHWGHGKRRRSLACVLASLADSVCSTCNKRIESAFDWSCGIEHSALYNTKRAIWVIQLPRLVLACTYAFEDWPSVGS